MWEGPWVCCLKKSGYRNSLTWKKVIFSCNGLNAGLSFIEQDEAVYESHVENVEKALGALLIWTGSSHPLTLREAWRVQCFKRWRCLTLLENWWESNITVPTRKGGLVSLLTSRNIHIVLTSLVYIPDVSLVRTQVSWLRWTNSSFEWTSPL